MTPNTSLERTRSYLFMAVLLLAVAGCGDELRGPEAVVTNHSDHALSNVVLSGSGFTSHIGRMTARSGESVTLHPIGESSLRVTFEVDGRQIDTGERAYFENSPRYAISVDIDRELNVTVSSVLKK